MIRVLLADDHAILRAGLRLLISSEIDMEVVAEAGDASVAAQQTAAVHPDVAIMDIDMPKGGGIGAINEIRRHSPHTRILILTIHDDLAYLRAALAAGAAGYVVKSAADTDLLTAIRTVYKGRTYVDVALRESRPRVLPQAPERGRASRPGQLSEREQEVLKLVALGHTHKEIAERAHLSIKTVETYRARIAEKLELRSRADLVRFALEVGLLDRSSGSGD